VITNRPWDLLRVTLAAAVLTSVWRIQDLFLFLAPLHLPVLMLLALLGLLIVSPREQWRLFLAGRSNVMRGVVVLVLLALLSMPTSLYKGQSLDYLLRNFLPAALLAFATAAAVYTVADARRVAAIQLGGAVLFCIVILRRFEVGPGGRLGSLVHYDANDLGLLMVCVLPLALYFVGNGVRFATRGLALGSVALFLVTIVKTGSRGAFLGLLAVTLYLLFRYSTVYWGRRVAILAGVAAIFMVTAGSQYRSTLATLLTPRSDYNWVGNTDGGRMAVWGRGIRYMLDRPLTGVGLAAFPIAEGTISPLAERQTYSRGVRWSAAHSSYVQIGAELGVVALLVFLSVLLGGLLLAGRLARDAAWRGEVGLAALARAQGAGLMGFIVAGAFLSHAYSPMLLVALGSIVGLDVAAREGWRRPAAA
jgi:O-antigen ligase